MAEQTQVQLTDQPVNLVIDDRIVIVENHWVEPEGAEYLQMDERSKDLLVLRMSPLDILPSSCVLAFVWLLLLGFSVGLVTGAPSALPKQLEESATIIGTLMGLTFIVLFIWAACDGIRKYINCHFYFDRGNGQIRLGPFPNSPCYALTDVVAIQLLERHPPKPERRLQLNLVLIAQGPCTQRINLQSGKDGIRHWPKCLEVMRRSSHRLAEFLDVPLIEQRAPDPVPLQKKSTVDVEELKKLTGTWLLVEADGRALTKQEPVRTIVRKDSGFRVKRGQDITLQGRFEIDSSQQPRHIDIRPNTGRDRGKTYLGIYQLEGEVYKECIAEVGKPRPEAFQFQPGINRLRVYKRIK